MNKAILIQKALNAGIESIQIMASENKQTSIAIYEQKVDKFKLSNSYNSKIRGIYQGKMGTCYVEDDSDEAIDYIIKTIIENASLITNEDEVEIYAGDATYPVVEQTPNTCLLEPVETKIALLQALELAILQSDSRIEQVAQLQYQEVRSHSELVNSKGIQETRDGDISVVSAYVIAKDGDDQKALMDYITLKQLSDLHVEAFAENVKDRLVARLHASQVPSQTYPVILEKEAMGSLLEAMTSIFNGENASKGISILKDSLGKQCFHKDIQILDDPLMKDGYNSASFDDEGVACKMKTIVERGVLKGYLHNLKSAKRMQTMPSGNGFGGGISSTNFYIKAGNTNYEDMIASMEKGVIIDELNGLHAGLNQITTDFSLQASGFYVEHGKIVKPINLITVAGNFMEMMKDIDCIGNDMKFQLSGVGAPSIKFTSLAISGE